MKVLIIGLPLFTERLVEQLSNVHDDNQYLRFDTYYKKLDKLKFWAHLNNADLVYSINGAISGSRAFEMVLDKGKKLVIHWVGTDVIKARKDFDAGRINQEIINRATHFCEVEWIQNELMEMGINARVVNFFSFQKEVKIVPLPSKFTILTYIAKNREPFYGIEEVYDMARSFPDVGVNIAGIDSYGELSKPDNVNLLGWINDMNDRMEQSTVCIRMAQHDGLSGFVLEALSRGRHVVYRFDYPHCMHAPSGKELQEHISQLFSDFNEGTLEVNSEGAKFIDQNFNRTFILSNLTEEFKRASDA